jgi:pimeloyl-ACP methyl ester carboxylesterase
MSRDKTYRPRYPAGITTAYHDGVYGVMRSRSIGAAAPGVPEIVLVQGMTVSDYLLPGLAALGGWTRAHLVDLPGCSGSGELPHEMDVREFAESVADWLRFHDLGPVLLAGHSSGTQVAAEAALLAPDDVRGVVLAAPAIDPVARGWVRVFVRWWLDRRGDPKSLDRCHQPERQRVGFRRLFHVLSEHLRHDIARPVRALTVPVLVVRGRQDRLSTPEWARGLAAGGEYAEVPGTHSFCWRYPDAWSSPIRAWTARIGSGDGTGYRSGTARRAP